MGGEAIYLYCVTSRNVDGVAALMGVEEGMPVVSHAHAGLVAWVSTVTLDDYVGEAGELNLQDVGWLGPRAVRHGALINAVMSEGAVFPLPFGTLFSSLDALDMGLDARRPEIVAALERVSGCQEWGVECRVDRDRAIDAMIRGRCDQGQIILPDAAGRRHLELQRLRRTIGPELRPWLQSITDTIATELDPLVTGRVERRSPRGEEGGPRWAFLVPLAQTDGFCARVAELARRHADEGLDLHMSGPWPPYSFCSAPG